MRLGPPAIRAAASACSSTAIPATPSIRTRWRPSKARASSGSSAAGSRRSRASNTRRPCGPSRKSTAAGAKTSWTVISPTREAGSADHDGVPRYRGSRGAGGPPGVPENAGALSLRAVRCARCRKSARKARVGAPAQVQLRPIAARPSSRRSARFGMPRSQSEVESRLASSRSRARRTAAPHSSGSRSPRPI